MDKTSTSTSTFEDETIQAEKGGFMGFALLCLLAKGLKSQTTIGGSRSVDYQSLSETC